MTQIRNHLDGTENTPMSSYSRKRKLISHPLASNLPKMPKPGIIMGGVMTVWLSLPFPVLALQVKVSPSSPQLGDTLSVVIQTNSLDRSEPTVVVKNKTYPAFPMGNGVFRTLLPTTPLDQAGNWSIAVKGEGKEERVTIRVQDRSFPTQSIWLPPGKDSEGTDYEFDRVDAFKALKTPEKLWEGPFLRPNQGEITTIYGVRRYYNGEFAKDYYHRGVDYAGAYGSAIIAPASGRVALVGRESEGFKIHGNVIGLDHGQGVVSIFLHLSRIDVKEGDVIKAGQVIGTLGSTGASTGPHLHWGLYVHGQSVDPVPWRTKGLE